MCCPCTGARAEKKKRGRPSASSFVALVGFSKMPRPRPVPGGIPVGRVVRATLLRELFAGVDPMDAANASLVDNGYPHTHMRSALVSAVLRAHEQQHRSNVTFWLECGSMLGGSLIRTAKVAQKLGLADGLSLVAIDPFTGDVNMWADETRATETNARFRFLRLRDGHPTIYERFLANVARAGLREAVLPIRTTATGCTAPATR